MIARQLSEKEDAWCNIDDLAGNGKDPSPRDAIRAEVHYFADKGEVYAELSRNDPGRNLAAACDIYHYRKNQWDKVVSDISGSVQDIAYLPHRDTGLYFIEQSDLRPNDFMTVITDGGMLVDGFTLAQLFTNIRHVNTYDGVQVVVNNGNGAGSDNFSVFKVNESNLMVTADHAMIINGENPQFAFW